jgi:hypothetical protein
MSPSLPARPAASEYDAYFQAYIDEVTGFDLLETLARQRDSTAAVLAGISDTKAGFRYADGKWSIREVIGHLADTERVFGYRALRVARGDPAPMPGFDENAWMPPSGFDQRTIEDLAAEFRAVRESTLALFGGLPAEAWTRIGTANGRPLSARACAWIISGHEAHHMRILRDRYLSRLEA